MPKSTPKRKIVNQKKKKSPPITNLVRIILSIGMTKIPKTRTIAITGRTETAVSLSFSSMFMSKKY